MTHDQARANPGYALGQLGRALNSARAHEEASVRERSAVRVEKWIGVIEGMTDGVLQVGSRTPVAGAPAWATLEVLHGGFASGELLAGGPLQSHETDLLARLGAGDDVSARTVLNAYFVSDDGRKELVEMLADGRFRVTVPEEGALLTVAWLLERGHLDRAEELLEVIVPHFDRLRFYPRPHPVPLVASTVVKLQTVGETIRQLTALRPNANVERMNEALLVWGPTYDRTVELFLETVEGDVPSLVPAADDRENGTGHDRREVRGGWPCRLYPDGWTGRARALLADYAELRRVHRLCGKPDRPKENFARLRGYLQTCVDDPAALTGRDVGAVRRVLASYVTKYGEPGSPRLAALRAEQREVGSKPTHHALRRALIGRLGALPPDDGVSSIEDLMSPVSTEEAPRLDLPVGTSIPEHLATKVARCLEATMDELVERDVIGSGETLARLLPQVTAQIRAAGLTDDALRRLFGAVYGAFRARRSLLLLNLEHQVQLEELPWVAAIDAFRVEDLGTKAAAREALEQIVLLYLTSFPQTIIPNKLVQELRAVAKSAGLSLPLVDEIAADIFMGEFTPKFVVAAKIAANLLAETLYARYYALPIDRVLAITDVGRRSKWAALSSPSFAALCTERAGVGGTDLWSVARNGAIIEQEQILTTHNLAVLFDVFGLAQALRGQLSGIARRCFSWVCRRQDQKVDGWRGELQSVKNCAYAWRQMVFFLALCPQAEHEDFLDFMDEELSRYGLRARQRLGRAVAGLRLVIRGGEFDADGLGSNGGRRFLGWATGRHWMLTE